MTTTTTPIVDLGATIAPKSDQLNADDLIVGPRTIVITSVKARAKGGPGEQPIAVHFEGDQGKPYLPCKSMRRVLVHCWGRDGAAYAGRSLTLFRDDEVVFGKVAVGGIRISHMSHIPAPVTMSLTASQSTRKPFTVRTLATSTAPTPRKKETTPEEALAKATKMLGTILLDIAGAEDVDATVAKHADMVQRLLTLIPDAADQVATAANDARKD